MKNLLIVLAILALSIPISADQLANGSFETGLTGWTFDHSTGSGGFVTMPSAGTPGGVWGAPTVPDGSSMLYKEVQGSSSGTGWVYQTFAATVGMQYTLTGLYSGYVAGSDPTNVLWEIDLYPGSYSHSNSDGGLYSVAKQTASSALMTPYSFGWTGVSVQFTASSSLYTVDLKWGGIMTNGYYGAYFDKFAVAPVPEPSGLLAMASGILGLGGLMIRRRK